MMFPKTRLLIQQYVETHPQSSILHTYWRLLRGVRKLRYFGFRYQCPVCSSSLRTFLPLPDKYRVPLQLQGRAFTAYDYETFNVDHYACPICFATDRERLYVLYLTEYSHNNGPRQTLVHFAPEKELSGYIRRTGQFHYRTADLFMSDVDDRVDITDMAAYAAESVDCFICSHILEHIPDDKKALKELHRILKKDGWGIIMAPLLPGLDRTYEDFSKTTDEERLKHFGQEDHVRVYAKKDFLQKLDRAGFDVQLLSVLDFGDETFNKHGINPKSILYKVVKHMQNCDTTK